MQFSKEITQLLNINFPTLEFLLTSNMLRSLIISLCPSSSQKNLGRETDLTKSCSECFNAALDVAQNAISSLCNWNIRSDLGLKQPFRI